MPGVVAYPVRPATKNRRRSLTTVLIEVHFTWKKRTDTIFPLRLSNHKELTRRLGPLHWRVMPRRNRVDHLRISKLRSGAARQRKSPCLLRPTGRCAGPSTRSPKRRLHAPSTFDGEAPRTSQATAPTRRRSS